MLHFKGIDKIWIVDEVMENSSQIYPQSERTFPEPLCKCNLMLKNV